MVRVGKVNMAGSRWRGEGKGARSSDLLGPSRGPSCHSHRPRRLMGIWSSVRVYGPHEWIKVLLHLFHLLVFRADITISIWEMRELSLKKKVRLLLKDTTLINKRNRARIQFHLIVTLDRYSLLNFLILERTNQDTKPGRKYFLELLLETVCSPLWNLSPPLFLLFSFFLDGCSRPTAGKPKLLIMSAEVWCFHYV